jgi:Methyltransferase domain
MSLSLRKGLAAARYAATLRFDAFFDAGARKSAARDRLLQMLPRHAVGAELGVFKGEFSARLVQVTRPSLLYLVDPYWTAYGKYYPDWGAYTDYGRLRCRDAFEQASRAVEAANEHGTEVHFHIGDDVEWLSGLPDASLDWVYIDSSHEYEHTRAELLAAKPKMKAHALICGDDWREREGGTGVPSAVQWFLAAYPYKLKFLEADQWVIGPRSQEAAFSLMRRPTPEPRADQ